MFIKKFTEKVSNFIQQPNIKEILEKDLEEAQNNLNLKKYPQAQKGFEKILRFKDREQLELPHLFARPLTEYISDAHEGLGDCFFAQKIYSVAALHYKDSLSLAEQRSFPFKQIELWLKLSECYFHSGKFELAYAELNKVLNDHFSTSTPFQKALILRGQCYFLEKKFQQAYLDFSSSHLRDKRLDTSATLLGLQNYAEAIKIAEHMSIEGEETNYIYIFYALKDFLCKEDLANSHQFLINNLESRDFSFEYLLLLRNDLIARNDQASLKKVNLAIFLKGQQDDQIPYFLVQECNPHWDKTLLNNLAGKHNSLFFKDVEIIIQDNPQPVEKSLRKLI